MREIADEAKGDRRALMRRQRGNRLPDRVVSGRWIDAGRIDLRRPLAGRATQMVDRLVVGDRQQPGTRRGVGAQTRVGAQCREKGVLEAVLRRLHPDHRPQRAPHRVAVLVEQDLEGRRR